MPSKMRDRILDFQGTGQHVPMVQEGFDASKKAYDTLSSYYDYGQGKLQSKNPVYYLADKIKRLMGSKYPSEVGSWSYPVEDYREPVSENLTAGIEPGYSHAMGEYFPDQQRITVYAVDPDRTTDTAAHELQHAYQYRETPSRSSGIHDADPESLMAPKIPVGSKFQDRMKRFLERSQENIKRSDKFPYGSNPVLSKGEMK